MKKAVCEHINLFPVVESHYCRADSDRKYLEVRLSIAEMYRLFKEENPRNAEIISMSMYSKIFRENFNYYFFMLKKDT